MTFLQFVGAPRGHHGPYTFYKGFNFFKHGKHKVILLGEFFFVRISTKDDPCIGELQLLWDDRHNNQRLSSVRLYFLPEQTPVGRLPEHGEDEVVAASDKVVLKLDDLVSWITDEVEWTHGLMARCQDDVRQPSELLPPSSGVVPEEDFHPEDAHDALPEENPTQPNGCAEVLPCGSQRPEESEISVLNEIEDKLSVLILSFSKYCRLRAIFKRLEGSPKSWLLNRVVIALEGTALYGRNTRVLFCRESFDHEDLAHHDFNCEHLAPVLKKKKNKKQSKSMRCMSPGSESNTSEDCKDSAHKTILKDLKMGDKQPPCKTKQEFLKRLFEFMKKRNTPIQRVPHLGFKQIDLFVFFTFAQKLGGYEKITGKKLWKHVYDELGGDPGSTSAATCTRRHYERLLLPFEKFLDGKVCKIMSSPVVLKPRKNVKSVKQENSSNMCEEGKNVDVASPRHDDAYAFTDSNLDNSKDSNTVEDINLVCEEQLMLNDCCSEGEIKEASWNNPKQDDSENRMDRNDANKEVKQILIQNGQGESFCEKERKWNEIRRKNALARKKVRQLRPSRSSKLFTMNPSLESSHLPPEEILSRTEVESSVEEQVLTKPAVASFLSDLDKNTISNPASISDNSRSGGNDFHIPKRKTIAIVDPIANKYLSDRIQSPSQIYMENSNCYPKIFSFHSKSQYSTALDETAKFHSLYRKSEPLSLDTKPKYGYLKDSMPYQKMSNASLGKYPPDYLSDFKASYVYDKDGSKELSVSGYHSDSSVLHGSGQVSISVNKSEVQTNEEPSSISQRRPSVIRHTELIVSPSSSQSSSLMSSQNTSNTFISNMSQNFPLFSNCHKTSIFPNHFSHSIADKVSEWMTKAVPEAIACKTPSMDKKNEFHDQVLTPSSSKTPNEGCKKILHTQDKNKSNVFSTNYKVYTQNQHKHNKLKVAENVSNRPFAHLSVNGSRNCTSWNQSGDNIPSLINTVSSRSATKSDHHSNLLPHQSIYPPNVPYYGHPKRHRSSTEPLPLLINQPSLHSSYHQIYRTSPHVEVPKIVPPIQHESEFSVLDLSVKSKSSLVEELPKDSQAIFPLPVAHLGEEQVCLDLTIKKRSNDNGIENISPRLTAHPNQLFSNMSFSLEPYQTALPVNDPSAGDPSRLSKCNTSQKLSICSKSPQQPLKSALFESSTSSSQLPANIHQRIHPSSKSTFHMASPKDSTNPVHNSKELHSHFAPFVIPSPYSSKWTSADVSLPINSSSSSQPSLNIYKGIAKHNVFLKHHLYNSQPQLYPVLCKDNSSSISKSK